MDEAPFHLGSDPALRIAVDVNLTAGHFAADVSPGGAVNVNLPRCHLCADPMHAGKIALEIEPLVAGIALHGKHLRQRDFAVAVKDLEPFDLGQ